MAPARHPLQQVALPVTGGEFVLEADGQTFTPVGRPVPAAAPATRRPKIDLTQAPAEASAPASEE